jgi:hypothetical protein
MRPAALAVLLLVAACGAPQPPRGFPGPGPVDPRQGASRLDRAQVAAVNRDPGFCRARLQAAGARHSITPGFQGPGACGYPWAVRREPDPRGPRWLPDSPQTSCGVALAVHIWERDILIPAARRHLGEPVVAIRQMAAYGCRTIGGRPGGQLSEHARANAIDISGFRTASGREISLIRDWHGEPRTRAFLREVRDGACGLFGTVLSPDYDRAHADHFHFDQADRRTPFCR